MRKLLRSLKAEADSPQRIRSYFELAWCFAAFAMVMHLLSTWRNIYVRGRCISYFASKISGLVFPSSLSVPDF